MKIIGILGGMSAASTQTCYREMCNLTRDRLGGLHSPELLIRSLDFAAIEVLQAEGDWESAERILNREAQALERGGAECLILATNTMHKLAEEMMQDVSIPLLHIADATAVSISANSLRSPGLMATAFTMEQTFYTSRLIAAGLSPIIPKRADRIETHRIIYEELCRNVVLADSEAIYIAIARRLVERGADCLILGCTEIGMLLNQSNVQVPVFDTTLDLGQLLGRDPRDDGFGMEDRLSCAPGAVPVGFVGRVPSASGKSIRQNAMLDTTIGPQERYASPAAHHGRYGGRRR